MLRHQNCAIKKGHMTTDCTGVGALTGSALQNTRAIQWLVYGMIAGQDRIQKQTTNVNRPVIDLI